MTLEELKAERERVTEQRAALDRRRYELDLAIEEAEGRPFSHEARFARAVLAGDGAAMTEMCAENEAEYRLKYGAFPQQHIRDRAEALLLVGDCRFERGELVVVVPGAAARRAGIDLDAALAFGLQRGAVAGTEHGHSFPARTSGTETKIRGRRLGTG